MKLIRGGVVPSEAQEATVDSLSMNGDGTIEVALSWSDYSSPYGVHTRSMEIAVPPSEAEVLRLGRTVHIAVWVQQEDPS